MLTALGNSQPVELFWYVQMLSSVVSVKVIICYLLVFMFISVECVWCAIVLSASWTIGDLMSW